MTQKMKENRKLEQKVQEMDTVEQYRSPKVSMTANNIHRVVFFLFKEICEKLNLISEMQREMKKEVKILEKDFKKSRISEKMLSEISEKFEDYEKQLKEFSDKFEKLSKKMNKLQLLAKKMTSVDESDWKNWGGNEFLRCCVFSENCD